MNQTEAMVLEDATVSASFDPSTCNLEIALNKTFRPLTGDAMSQTKTATLEDVIAAAKATILEADAHMAGRSCSLRSAIDKLREIVGAPPAIDYEEPVLYLPRD